MIKLTFRLLLLFLVCQFHSFGQANNPLLKNVQAKMDKVTDYEAEGKMRTNVAFLKLPIAKVKLYFKNPNKFKLKSENLKQKDAAKFFELFAEKLAEVFSDALELGSSGKKLILDNFYRNPVAKAAHHSR